MGLIFLLFYLVFSLLVASAGRRTTIGFWGVLALCLIFTPLLMAILMTVLKPMDRF